MLVIARKPTILFRAETVFRLIWVKSAYIPLERDKIIETVEDNYRLYAVGRERTTKKEYNKSVAE